MGAALDAWLATGATHARTLGSPFDRLWDALTAAGRGGRGLRPALVLAAHDALGGTEHTAASAVADAVELLHTAFLVHDDVVDHDLVRRGGPNVAGRFVADAHAAGHHAARAADHGLAAGVLAGDLALVGATRLVARAGADPATTERLLDLLEAAVRESAAGELADVLAGRHPDGPVAPPSTADALQVAERKTAVYSCSLPLRAGALLAGADDAVLRDLDTLGRALGTAFQLVDDLLGVFGDPAQTGKSATCDLREGKATALVALAARTTAWPTIARHLGDPALTDDDAARLRGLLVACGARGGVERLVAGRLDVARGLAEPLGLGGVLRIVEELLAPALEQSA